jgi:hypothetical protein
MLKKVMVQVLGALRLLKVESKMDSLHLG